MGAVEIDQAHGVRGGDEGIPVLDGSGRLELQIEDHLIELGWARLNRAVICGAIFHTTLRTASDCAGKAARFLTTSRAASRNRAMTVVVSRRAITMRGSALLRTRAVPKVLRRACRSLCA